MESRWKLSHVGDGNTDHQCWERLEDMDMPQTLYQINSSSPKTEMDVDASAALSSATIALGKSNSSYSKSLLRHSQALGVYYFLLVNIFHHVGVYNICYYLSLFLQLFNFANKLLELRILDGSKNSTNKVRI